MRGNEQSEIGFQAGVVRERYNDVLRFGSARAQAERHLQEQCDLEAKAKTAFEQAKAELRKLLVEDA